MKCLKCRLLKHFKLENPGQTRSFGVLTKKCDDPETSKNNDTQTTGIFERSYQQQHKT